MLSIVSCRGHVFDPNWTFVRGKVFLFTLAEHTLLLDTRNTSVLVLVRFVLLVDIIVLFGVLNLFQVKQFLELE